MSSKKPQPQTKTEENPIKQQKGHSKILSQAETEHKKVHFNISHFFWKHWLLSFALRALLSCFPRLGGKMLFLGHRWCGFAPSTVLLRDQAVLLVRMLQCESAAPAQMELAASPVLNAFTGHYLCCFGLPRVHQAHQSGESVRNTAWTISWHWCHLACSLFKVFKQ